MEKVLGRIREDQAEQAHCRSTRVFPLSSTKQNFMGCDMIINFVMFMLLANIISNFGWQDILIKVNINCLFSGIFFQYKICKINLLFFKHFF